MNDTALMNPARQEAANALAEIFDCIDHGQSFLVEAGAGAGKTESLVKSLRYLIEKQGNILLRRHQAIACITFTNVASGEIESRTDRHKAIWASTIHAFCWSIIKDFQPYLREHLVQIDQWKERLAEVGDIGARSVDYQLGIRKVEKDVILLGHDDVLSLTISLLEKAKFREIMTARYPILLIDEYQDTNRALAQALTTHFLETKTGPLIGFFGDHWQKIYGDGCGKIEHPALKLIGQKSNFRSVKTIVDVLNRIRPELPQQVSDPEATGQVQVFLTNEWSGSRRTGPHWKGDLPATEAHSCLENLKKQLSVNGWKFDPDQTKILMLTHKILADEQGYRNLADVFSRNELFIKKEDPYIAFFVDTLEPACIANENKRYGEMFAVLGSSSPPVNTHQDKISWAKDMDTLLELRNSSSIGAILDHLRQTKHPELPDIVERVERKYFQQQQNPDPTEAPAIERIQKLRNVAYQEVIALARFIDGHSPFSTKHGVKGIEFENVLVVIGRGWNSYDFNQMLELAKFGVSKDKQEFYESNRNLFYVCCSRPRKRLALLFTQLLSNDAMETIAYWFGEENIHSLIET